MENTSTPSGDSSQPSGTPPTSDQPPVPPSSQPSEEAQSSAETPSPDAQSSDSPEADNLPVSAALPGGMVNGAPMKDNGSKKPGKGKLVIIAVVIVLLLAAGAAAYMKFGKKSTTPTAKTTTPTTTTQTSQTTEPAASTPAGKIATDLAKYKVAAADAPDSKNATVFYMIDDTSFGVTESSTTQYYKFEHYTGTKVETYCDAPWATYGKYFDAAKTTFTTAGYKTTDVAPTTQYENCEHAFVATNATENCSVFYFDNVLGDSVNSTFGIKVSCKPLADLKDEVAEGKEMKQIITEGDSKLKIRQLNYYKEYIKDSKTSGYQIAVLTDNAAGNKWHFYKKTGGKWTDAMDASTGDFICAPTGPNATDIKKAFVGETCINGTSEATVTL